MKNSAANKLKQVPVGYLVIGIDPHKKKHRSYEEEDYFCSFVSHFGYLLLFLLSV